MSMNLSTNNDDLLDPIQEGDNFLSDSDDGSGHFIASGPDDDVYDDYPEDDYNKGYDEFIPNAPDNSTPELSAIDIFLQERGFKDANTVLMENDRGVEEEVAFDSLSKDEQLTILRELTRPNINEHERATINYMRRSNRSLDSIIKDERRDAVQGYINAQNQRPAELDNIAEYSDDAIFLADLHRRFPNLTDEALYEELDMAKGNEELFQHKVDTIRDGYAQAVEDEYARREQDKYDQYEQFYHAITDAVTYFDGVPIDFRDVGAGVFALENHEKQAVFDYITQQDETGVSQFFKDINNPNTMVELAWFNLYGKEALSGMTNYYKQLLSKPRTQAPAQKAKPKAAVASRGKNRVSNPGVGLSALHNDKF